MTGAGLKVQERLRPYPDALVQRAYLVDEAMP
jgi:hypothetical protein